MEVLGDRLRGVRVGGSGRNVAAILILKPFAGNKLRGGVMRIWWAALAL